MKQDIDNSAPPKTDKRWFCVELPAIEYREAWNLQGRLVAARKDRVLDKNIILLLEHFPVFTLGRRGGLNNLKISKAFIESRGIQIVHVERGGDITFHGPGQLVVYPIIDLLESRLGVADYVTALEEVMIRAAADQGVVAKRNRLNRGVWVDNNKLASIGIAVRRGVSFHGIALNVNTSLEPFTWVHPCGLEGVKVTSMKQVLGREIDMKDVRSSVKSHIREIFGVELEWFRLEDMYRLLDGER